MNPEQTINQLVRDVSQATLEREQALIALRLIVEQRRINSLTGLLEAIDAASALLTKLEPRPRSELAGLGV